MAWVFGVNFTRGQERETVWRPTLELPVDVGGGVALGQRIVQVPGQGQAAFPVGVMPGGFRHPEFPSEGSQVRRHLPPIVRPVPSVGGKEAVERPCPGIGHQGFDIQNETIGPAHVFRDDQTDVRLIRGEPGGNRTEGFSHLKGIVDTGLIGLDEERFVLE